MIKIIEAHENPAIEGFTEPSVHILIDIEGYTLHIGGIDPSWDRATLMPYLNNQYDDLLQKAIQGQGEHGALELRYDLTDQEGLPHSEHIGKLISVNPGLAKPAVIRRRFQGRDYDINCLVTQSVKNLYQSGDIQVEDYVLVSFIEEMPNETERNIAIVTDKVYPSW